MAHHYVTPIMKYLAEARKEQNLSRLKLAMKAGYHYNQIAMWETGIHQPGAAVLTNCADALGKDIVLVNKQKQEKKQFALMEE